jgi:urea transport system ATP-binding protein
VTVLGCSDLAAGYGRVQIIDGVSLEIEAGECLALLGKNGMGKTTLLKALTGISDQFAGEVTVLGTPVSDWPTHRIMRLGVSYVFQDEPLFEDLTVEENLRLGGLRLKDFAAARDDVIKLFPRLAERKKQKAGDLSGGEQKMLMIARALLPRPSLVLLDEVSEGLQPAARDMLGTTLASYRDERRTAVLLVEQNVGFALSVADRFAVLLGGRIAEQGRVDDAEAVANIEQHMIL